MWYIFSLRNQHLTVLDNCCISYLLLRIIELFFDVMLKKKNKQETRNKPQKLKSSQHYSLLQPKSACKWEYLSHIKYQCLFIQTSSSYFIGTTLMYFHKTMPATLTERKRGRGRVTNKEKEREGKNGYITGALVKVTSQTTFLSFFPFFFLFSFLLLKFFSQSHFSTILLLILPLAYKLFTILNY